MKKTGSVVLLVLVFGGIFFAMLAALSSFVLVENRAQDVTRENAEAFAVAEAGLQYYRWFLSHFPGNTQNNTGHNGPFVISYADPEGGTAGTYTLSIVGNSSCGQIQSVDVSSKGVPSDAPGIAVNLWARYAQPSVAAYAYVLNTNAWFASTVYGQMHSNGGIRMDGNPNAPVTSSVSTWNCDSSNGCSPTQSSAPGVVGNGSNTNLWSWPTPQMDFAGIAANFSSLKTTAQASGLYFARVSTNTSTGSLGYHLIFNSNGTVTVKQVTATDHSLTSVFADGSSGSSEVNDYSLISTETTKGTYAIPSGCGLIFVEDNAWIEGTVSGKVTVVAANVSGGAYNPNIVIPANLTYNVYDGTAGLTAMASNDVLIGPSSPDSLTMNGIFVAQTGVFGRNLYTCKFPSYDDKTNLTVLGTIVSALKPSTRWTYSGYDGCSSGSTSGYTNRTASFDRQNSTNPPPFTPYTSSQWEFVDWQQK